MTSKMVTAVRMHFWTLLFLAVLLIGSFMAVGRWKSKHPGSMTVIEAQAMDMTQMKPPEGAVPVATEIVHLQSFTATVSYTGSVAPIEEQVIYPRVDGWLKDLRVYNGDTVSQGQLLAVVDSPNLQSSAAAAASEISVAQHNAVRMNAEKGASQADIESANSEIARARAGVAARQKAVVQAEKQVTTAKANADYWAAEIERESNLLKAGAVSKQEYQSERSQATAAEAALESSNAALGAAKADLEGARAEVAGKESMLRAVKDRSTAAAAASSGATAEVKQKAAMAETASIIDSYRYMRAPFAGVVTARYVSPGQLVSASTAVLGVAQIDRVRLQANVADKDLSAIRVGTSVTARFAKDPKLVVKAVVSSVAPQTNQDSRTAVVEAIVPNPGHKLIPGDSVTLQVAVSQESQVLTVPASAVVQKDGDSAVWVVVGAKPGKVTYYCTMHPEVTSDKPGNCYKCGMKLVPEKSGSGKKAHLVRVVLGSGGGERVQVISGLADGEEVIYQGNTYLREGDIVEPVRWTSEGPAELPQAPAMGEMPGMGHEDKPAASHEAMPGMTHEATPGASHEAMPGMQDMATKQKPATQKTYVCPMHAEVTSHNPKARCPKCGMKLEEKK